MKTTIENSRISGAQTSLTSLAVDDDLGIEPIVESSVQFATNPETSLVASPFPQLNPPSASNEALGSEVYIESDSALGSLPLIETEIEAQIDEEEISETDSVEFSESDSAEPILWESAAERVGQEAAASGAILEHEKLRIPEKTFFKIGEVAEILKLKPYVLRYWETEFPFAAPEKKASGQRVYRRAEVETLVMIKHLLYNERYSIEGARKRIKELRKEGDLRKFKKETVAENVAQNILSPEKKKRILESLEQLRELSRKTLGDFFRL